MSNVHGFTVKDAKRFQLIAFKEVRVKKTGQYFVKKLLPRNGMVVVWGPPKCGKSFWITDLLLHVSFGWEYRGLRVKQGTIVYCVLEGAHGYSKRIEAFRMRRLNEADDADPPFHLMETPLDLIRDHKALINDVREQLGGAKPNIICIDTLNRSLVGSENSDEDMTAYIRASDVLRAAFDCLVVIIHHCPHDAQRPRGHSSLIGALDVQIAVKRDPANNVVAELELAKDGEPGLVITSRLEQVEIGVDEDGEIILSCVVEEVGTPTTEKKKGAKPPKLSDQTMIALKALHKAVAEMGQSAPGSNTIPPKATVVTTEQWETYVQRSGLSDAKDEKDRHKAFRRAHDSLIAKALVGAWLDYRWIV
jgi:hypothetical protein